MRVLLQVTHLLGSGHLSRALTLARAFAERGHTASVLSGGMPVPHLDAAGVDLVQLPPLSSDGVNFGTLLDAQGDVAAPDYLAARTDLARQTLNDLRPDALITELFPFGRKALAAEFLALLGAAGTRAHRPVILSSIRDILAPPSKPAKAERAERHIAQFYDGVLVHSDAAITPLELSWPVSPALAAKLHYTGFVAPPLSAPARDLPAGEIIVSAGGGSVGAHVFNAALEAARLSPDRWRILIGGADAAARCRALQDAAPPNACIEPVRPDFRQLLQHAACSVSLCGYNTAMDLLQTGCPAVFIPFDEGSEVEQGLRAAALSARSGIEMLPGAELTAQTLLERITRARAGRAQASPANTLHFDGAARTVDITATLVRDLAQTHV